MGIAEWFMSISNAKKMSYIVLMAVAISALAMLFLWAGQPQYQLLYANLSNEDAAVVIDKLSSANIPYEVGGGGTISVPKDDVYETRLKLAGEGIPKGGGVGFEIFDKTGFGVTEFVQKVNYLRATQGELARTISGLTEVDSARVHIVVPEKRLFRNENDTARASVVLKLVSNSKLASDKVQGVVNLVAGSVAGLTPQNITVIDTTGRLLTRAVGDDGPSLLSSNQLEYQRSVEKGLEARIKSILEPVVGVNKVKASVSVDIDFKQVEKTEERFDPDGAVVRSEQTSKEKVVGGSTGGVPGVASNVPGAGGATTATASAPGSTRQNDTINYEISKVVSRTVEPTGLVKRLSVAVLVDGAYTVTTTGDGEEAVSTSEYKPRSEDEIKKFEDLIRGAIGYSIDRGDSIEVVNIPFESKLPIMDFEDAEATMLEMYLPEIIRYGSIMLITLLVLFLVIRPLISNIFKASPMSMAPGPLGAGVPLPAGGMPMTEEAIPEEQVMPTSPAAEKKKNVRQVVEGNPEQSAQIIKRWVRGKADEE